jgi:hypothetical protein
VRGVLTAHAGRLLSCANVWDINAKLARREKVVNFMTV